MSIWTAKWDILYYDDEPAVEGWLCEVRLDDQEMVISYEEDGERRMYIGRAAEPGHYVVENEAVGGKGTFHRFNRSLKLEGSWIEDNTRGMWILHLEEEKPSAGTQHES